MFISPFHLDLEDNPVRMPVFCISAVRVAHISETLTRKIYERKEINSKLFDREEKRNPGIRTTICQ